MFSIVARHESSSKSIVTSVIHHREIMEKNKREEMAAELSRAKQELLLKRRKLRRYDKALKTKKHVQETLVKHNDEFQYFEIKQSGTPAVIRDAEVNRTVTFRAGSPDIINASSTSGENSRDSVDSKANEIQEQQRSPSDASVQLQQEDCVELSPRIKSSLHDICMNVEHRAEDVVGDHCDIAEGKIQNESMEASSAIVEFEEEKISELGKALNTMCTKEKEECESAKDSFIYKKSKDSDVQCIEDPVTSNDKMVRSETYENRDSETSIVLEDVKIKRKCSQKKRLRHSQTSPGNNRESQSEGSSHGNDSVASATCRTENKTEGDLVTPSESKRDLVAPHSEHTFAQNFTETSVSVKTEIPSKDNTVKCMKIDGDEDANHFPDNLARGHGKKVDHEKCICSVTEADEYSCIESAELVSTQKEFLDDSVMDDLTQVCSDKEQSRIEIDLKESIQHYFVSYGKVISSALTSVLYKEREVLYFILIQCECVSLWTSEGDKLYLSQEMEGNCRTNEVPLQMACEQQPVKIKSVSKVLHSFAGVDNGIKVQVVAWPGEEEVRFAVLQPSTREQVNLTYFQYDVSGSWLINSAALNFGISTKWTALSAFATGEWELTLYFHEKSLDTTAKTPEVTEKTEGRAGGSLLGADLYSIELDLTYSRKWHKWQLACDVQKHGKLRPAPASLTALQTTDEGSICCWLCDEGLSIFSMKNSQILCEVPIVGKEVNYNWILHLAVAVKGGCILMGSNWSVNRIWTPSCTQRWGQGVKKHQS